MFRAAPCGKKSRLFARGPAPKSERDVSKNRRELSSHTPAPVLTEAGNEHMETETRVVPEHEGYAPDGPRRVTTCSPGHGGAGRGRGTRGGNPRHPFCPPSATVFFPEGSTD